jgi:hypothetical protein
MRLWRVGLCRSMYSYSDDGRLRRTEPGWIERGVRARPSASLSPLAREVALGSREAACGQAR